MYAKIKNGELSPAPIEFVENGKRIRGFTADFLTDRGYMPVVYDDYPGTEDDTTVYNQVPEVVDGVIRVRWVPE